MLLLADSWISPLIVVADARTASKASRSKCSVASFYLSAKLNFTSIGEIGSLLYNI